MLHIKNYVEASPYYKLSILSVTGVLMSKENESYKWDLYQIDTFYVQVRYSKKMEGNNFRMDIKCFTNSKLLAPYLQLIDVSNIIH